MFIPPGDSTVTPYIFVNGAANFIEFLVVGLGATELDRHVDGERMANAQCAWARPP